MFIVRNAVTDEVVLITTRREDCEAFEQTKIDKVEYVIDEVNLNKEIDND